MELTTELTASKVDERKIQWAGVQSVQWIGKNLILPFSYDMTHRLLVHLLFFIYHDLV
jgi:hypothetical protein